MTLQNKLYILKTKKKYFNGKYYFKYNLKKIKIGCKFSGNGFFFLLMMIKRYKKNLT